MTRSCTWYQDTAVSEYDDQGALQIEQALSDKLYLMDMDQHWW